MGLERGSQSRGFEEWSVEVVEVINGEELHGYPGAGIQRYLLEVIDL